MNNDIFTKIRYSCQQCSKSNPYVNINTKAITHFVEHGIDYTEAKHDTAALMAVKSFTSDNSTTVAKWSLIDHINALSLLGILNMGSGFRPELERTKLGSPYSYGSYGI